MEFATKRYFLLMLYCVFTMVLNLQGEALAFCGVCCLFRLPSWISGYVGARCLDRQRPFCVDWCCWCSAMCSCIDKWVDILDVSLWGLRARMLQDFRGWKVVVIMLRRNLFCQCQCDFVYKKYAHFVLGRRDVHLCITDYFLKWSLTLVRVCHIFFWSFGFWIFWCSILRLDLKLNYYELRNCHSAVDGAP